MDAPERPMIADQGGGYAVDTKKSLYKEIRDLDRYEIRMQDAFVSEELEAALSDENWDEFASIFIAEIELGYQALAAFLENQVGLGEREIEEMLGEYLQTIDELIEGCSDDELLDRTLEVQERIARAWLDYLSEMETSIFFKVENLPLEMQLKQMLFLSQYEGKIQRGLGYDSFKQFEELGGYHIFHSDAFSIDSLGEITKEQKRKGWIPSLTSYDFEGGVVRPIRVTIEELKGRNFPERFLPLLKVRELPSRLVCKVRDKVELFLDSVEKIDTKYRVDDLMSPIPGIGPIIDSVADSPELFDLIVNATKSEWVLFPSQEEIGQLYEEVRDSPDEKKRFLEDYKQYAACIAAVCRDAGITINFAPNVDLTPAVDYEGFSKEDSVLLKEDRSYGSDPEALIDLATAYIEGFESKFGPKVVAKHFMGMGHVSSDVHRDAATFMDGASREDKLREARRLNTVFGHLLSQVSGVMTTHIVIPDLYELWGGEPRGEGEERPMITISREDIQYLRDKEWGLGFDGMVVSDDLNMGAMKERFPDSREYAYTFLDDNGRREAFMVSATTKRIIETIVAGHDMVLCVDEIEKVNEIVGALRKMVEYEVDSNDDGIPDITREQIQESVQRIMEFKHEVGLLDKIEVEGETEGERERYYYFNDAEYLPVPS